MESDRVKAKQAITNSDSDEPELAAVLSVGQGLRLEIENHRHKEAMRAHDLGMMGKIFGSEAYAPIWIAAIIAFAGVLMATFSLIQGSRSMEPNSADYWNKLFERCLAFSLSSLTFIFGRSGRK
jgi:hypothetical protein